MIKLETPQFLQRFKDRITAKVATATLVVLAGGGMVYRGVTMPRGTAPTKAQKVKVATGANALAQANPNESEDEVVQPETEPPLYGGGSDAPLYGNPVPDNGLRNGTINDDQVEGANAETEVAPPSTSAPPLYGGDEAAPPTEAPGGAEQPPASPPVPDAGGAPALVGDMPPPPAEDNSLMAPPPSGGSLGKGGLKRRVPGVVPKTQPPPVPSAPAPKVLSETLSPNEQGYLGATRGAAPPASEVSPAAEAPSDPGAVASEPPAAFASPEKTNPPRNQYRDPNASRGLGGVPQPVDPAPAPAEEPTPSYGSTAPAPLATEAPVTGGLAPVTQPSVDIRPVPSLSDAAVVAGTAAVPGDRKLEGAQTPAVTLEKVAPPEIQVGRPATFEVRVRNVGQVAAHHVVVSDQIPRGTQLQGTKPEAKTSDDGSIVWQLGTIPPGQEVMLAMQVVPEQEGEIGSIAQVGFAAQATAKTVCTRPMLKVEHTAPKQVLIGETVNVSILVENPGSGAAAGVIIEEDVPEGLEHDGGRELEYEVGTLSPGQSRRLDLQMRASKPGIVQNTIHVRGEGNLVAQHDIQIEVVAPQLAIGIDGPKKRFLDRQATYTLSLANPGTASARNVEMVAYLPRGVKFVQTDSQGQYDARQHAVFWALEELPNKKKGTVKLTVLPVEAGEQVLRVDGRGDLGLSATQEQVVQVEGVTELAYSIADLADPVEVGGENTYEIRVVNNGSRAVTNVVVVAQIPAGIQAKEGEGPTAAATAGQKVTFEPLARMNPQDEAVFRIHCQAVKEGDYLIKVQLACDEFPTPVSKEESTRVYTDR
ncbi:MAG: hypothetical protein ACO1RA_08290 [Planctomycetaceae bacterium]